MSNAEEAKSYVPASKGTMYVSITFFFICAACFLAVIGYLLFINPEVNPVIKQREEQRIEDQLSTYKEMKYNLIGDVAVENEIYPLVVLRTGYKLLRIENDKDLIAWAYDVLNTSPSNDYDVSVEFILEDKDGFQLGKDDQEKRVGSQEMDTIRGGIKIPSEDLGKLYDTTWYLSLSQNWTVKEKDVKGNRYERMTQILASENYRYSWIFNELIKNEGEFSLLGFSEKWKAIRKALEQLRKEAEKEE